MHIHLPKPLHGWREFAGEVGIIVIGILIALGGEQLVEIAHARERATEAREAVDHELAMDAGVFDERTMVQPCLNQRLAELAPLLRDARRTGHIPDIGEIGRPPTRPIRLASWDSAVANGTMIRFDRRAQEVLPTTYGVIQDYRAAVESEQAMWATLTLLEDSAGPIPDAMLTEVSATVARLRYRSLLNGISADQNLTVIKDLGIPVNYFILIDRDGGRREDMAKAVAERPVCQPLTVDGKPFRAAV